MINLTDSACAQFKKILFQTEKVIFLTLTPTGCSGLSYKLDIVDRKEVAGALPMVISGVQIMIDSQYLQYLQDLTIDYKKEGFNTSFHFINPREKDRCGCGLSFRV